MPNYVELQEVETKEGDGGEETKEVVLHMDSIKKSLLHHQRSVRGMTTKYALDPAKSAQIKKDKDEKRKEDHSQQLVSLIRSCLQDNHALDFQLYKNYTDTTKRKDSKKVISKLLASLCKVRIKNVVLFRDAKTVEASYFQSAKGNDMLEVVISGIQNLMVNRKMLLELSFADLWWLSRRIAGLLSWNLETRLVRLPIEAVTTLITNQIYKEAKWTPGFELDSLHFKLFDKDFSGGLCIEQAHDAIAAVLEDLTNANLVSVGASEQYLAGFSEKFQTALEAGLDEDVDDADDDDATETESELETDTDNEDSKYAAQDWINPDQFLGLVQDVIQLVGAAVPFKDSASIKQLVACVRSGILFRAVSNTAVLPTKTVQKSWRVVLEELFDTNGKVNILHMAFKHFDNKQSGKINYSQVIEATHKVLGPASRLRMFDGADFSGCLPRDDPALEKKGNIFNVQQFITIVFKSLTRLLSSKMSRVFLKNNKGIDWPTLQKLKAALDEHATDWMYTPGSAEHFTQTLLHLPHGYTEDDAVRVRDFFAFLVRPDLPSVPNSSPDYLAAEKNLISQYGKQLSKEDGKKQSIEMWEAMRLGVHKILKKVINRLPYIHLDTPALEKLFRVNLNPLDVSLSSSFEFIKFDTNYISCSTLLQFLSDAVVLMCRQSRKLILSHLQQSNYREKSTTFVKEVWQSASRCGSSILNHQSQEVWTRRISIFCRADPNIKIYFDVEAKKNSVMSKSQAFACVETILVPLQRATFAFPDGLIRSLQATPPGGDAVWSAASYDFDTFLQLLIACWSEIVTVKLKESGEKDISWSSRLMFSSVSEENANRALALGADDLWNQLLRGIQIDSMLLHFISWCSNTLDDFHVQIQSKVFPCTIHVKKSQSFGVFEAYETYFWESVKQGCVQSCASFKISGVDLGVGFQKKLVRDLTSGISKQLDQCLSETSSEFWVELLQPSMNKRSNRNLFDDIFDLEDDNQSGTLRRDQVVSIIRLWFFPTKKSDQNLASYLQQDLCKSIPKKFAKVDEFLDEFVEDEEYGLENDNETEGVVKTEISKKEFCKALTEALANMILDCQGKFKHPPSYTKPNAPTFKEFSASVVAILANLAASVLAVQKPDSAAVWMPTLNAVFKQPSIRAKFEAYFKIVRDEADLRSAGDLHSFWKDKITVLFTCLDGVEIKNQVEDEDYSLNKLIYLYEDDELSLITPSEEALDECLLEEEESDVRRRLLNLVKDLLGVLVVANGGLLRSCMEDLGLQQSQILQIVVEEVAGVANGFFLVNQLPKDVNWLDHLRERLTGSTSFLENFFRYIDDDLSARLDIEEVRIGIYMLYQKLPLPGFDLDALPNRHDIDFEEVEGPMQLRKILQDNVSTVLKEYKAEILNKAQILRQTLQETQDDDEVDNRPLSDWTIDYIVDNFIQNITEKTSSADDDSKQSLLVMIASLFFLPTVYFLTKLKSVFNHRAPFCYRNRKYLCFRSSGQCAWLWLSIGHGFIVYPTLTIIFFSTVIVYGAMFSNLFLFHVYGNTKSSAVDETEIYTPLVLAFMFVAQWLIKLAHTEDVKMDKGKQWRRANLSVSGQMEVTYLEGEDRLKIEDPLSFAESLFDKVKRKFSENDLLKVLRYVLMVLLAMVHCLIPAVYRHYDGNSSTHFMGAPSTNVTEFFTTGSGLSTDGKIDVIIVIVNWVVCFPCLLLLMHLLHHAYNVHFIQAQSLRLLAVATDSREAQPERLLNSFIDLAGGSSNNLDCWLFARDHLKGIHKFREGYASAIIAPVLSVDLALMILIFLRAFVMKAKFDIINVLGVYDSLLLAGWLVGIMWQFVSANEKLKETHLQVLETTKLQLVNKIQDAVVRSGKEGISMERKGSGGVAFLRRRSSLLAADTDAEDDDGATESGRRMRRNSFAADTGPPEDSSSPGKLDSQETRELRVSHLRVSSAISTLQTLDEPLRLFGIVVDKSFLAQVASVIVAGAASGLSQLLESL
mmetsp:Transcript_13179/g.25589  ORF Transcript_13179/g.25589 Transcript_13179/m.25589 type:complete len:1975 (+) Transcript_13179:20-5944(+)